MIQRSILVGLPLLAWLAACAPTAVGPAPFKADDLGCAIPPADAFTETGVDLDFAQSTFNKIVVGEIKIKTTPQVVDLASATTKDARVAAYIECREQKQGWTPEQVVYRQRLTLFAATKPTSQQFAKWQADNPFPK